MPSQTVYWFILYTLLIICLGCLFFLINNSPFKKEKAETISFKQKLTWLWLSFMPSSLLLSTTLFISTDIAAIPLFWVIPFALYLIAFIAAFSNYITVQTLDGRNTSLTLLVMLLLYTVMTYLSINQIALVLIHLSLFFLLVFLLCVKLYNLRPAAADLTQYYIYIAFGGALGGIFNVFIAPHIFLYAEEYSLIALIAAFTLRYVPMLMLFTLVIMLPNWLPVFADLFHPVLYKERSFYGRAQVTKEIQNKKVIHLLRHGTTLHGFEVINEPSLATSYYHNQGPLGSIFQIDPNIHKVAVLGLGAGTMATYSTSSRTMDFFEVDPMMEYIAKNTKLFSFLNHAKGLVKIIIGDGRIKIQQQPNHIYDLILVDAFNSDNIPIHLITKEAILIYLEKLKVNGVLVFHISNRWLNLEPVLSAAGDQLQQTVLIKRDDIPLEFKNPSTYAVLLTDSVLINKLLAQGWQKAYHPKDFRVWGDDYSNVFSTFEMKKNK